MNDGFTVTIDSSCKASTYSQLPADNNGLFAYASNLPATENVTAVIDGLANVCKFDGLNLSLFNIYLLLYSATGTITMKFSECGTLQSETTDNDTTLTTYIHHQVVTGVEVISLMSQMQVNCVVR